MSTSKIQIFERRDVGETMMPKDQMVQLEIPE